MQNDNAYPESKALRLDECLAKTRVTENQERVGGYNVFDHCLIVGEVAKELVMA